MKNYVLVKEKQLEALLEAVAKDGKVGVVELGPQIGGQNLTLFNGKVINIVGKKDIWVDDHPETSTSSAGYERDFCDKI